MHAPFVMMNSSTFKLVFVHLCCLVLLLTLRFGICREIVCIPSERETLLKVKNSLSDPSNRLPSWNVTANSNCCKWAGVVCNNVTAHVVELHLNISPPNFDDLGGEINSCLVDLKHLNYLDFSGNYFHGMSILSFLGNMSTLTHLNLSYAGLMGNIPHQIGNLSNLLYLDLGTNDLSPENLDPLLSLSKLEYLDLGDADLSESFNWLQTLQALPSLMELHLSNCMLPDHYNQPSLLNFSSLLTLDLSATRSSLGFSFVPNWIFGLKKLVSLQLPNAGIQGPIPDGMQNLTLLQNLDLSVNLFSSSVPDWLYGLHHLKFLDLSNNELRGLGTISNALGNFTSLLELDLSFNQLEGIPTSLGNLTSLIKLDLSNNKLQGTIPTSLGNLASLIKLDLSNNQLQGTIPTSFGNLTSLIKLDFSNNQLQGTVPTSSGNLTSLIKLDLSNNQLEGIIPTSLGNLTSLIKLDLSNNQLEGIIPTSLGNLTSLIKLDLSNNQLQGTIPTSLGNLCNLRKINFSGLKLNQQINQILEFFAPCVSRRLKTLAVESSQLSGNLTDQFGAFENIVELHFSNNLIGGALPSSFGKLSSLNHLDLSKNQFSGNPFESLRSLSKLSHLDISDNHFLGVVRENDLVNLTSLNEFYASGNNLTLKVGSNWLPSFHLSKLDMRSWQLGPNFPSWIQSQGSLDSLQMSNTGIFDSVPSGFWESFSHRSYINLSHNHIHGELATTLSNPISIGVIDLSTNHLYGKLPYISNQVNWLDLSSNSFSESMDDFLCNNQQTHMGLQLLNLASNNLSSEIPDCWGIWVDLVDVDLQNNNLVGNLPQSMGSLTELQYLQIRNNSLSGIFPTVLKNNDRLIFLDLGENSLSGTIPAWVGEKLLKVKILLLRSNNFSGPIPNEICHVRLLQILDLAQNNLSGNIPSCLNQLKAMTLMNKSTDPLVYSEAQMPRSINFNVIPLPRFIIFNQTVSVLLWLKGRGDEYKNFLGLVASIDLSKNTLSGEIPKEITNLNGLNFLNLSHNQLNGRIPQNIGNMGSLLSIDFSRNQLSGEIPPTITNLNFLSMLNLSYNHLKGKIPTGTQLQTFDASNFIGNNLCGAPLPTNCSSNGKVHDEEKSDKHGVNWFFVSMTFGFIVGFWAVVAPLFIWRSWRYAYYHFLDQVWFKLQSLW